MILNCSYQMFERAPPPSLSHPPPTQRTRFQQTDHPISKPPMTCWEKQGRRVGKQGGHIGASNALPNDAVYEKAFVFRRLILMLLVYIRLFSSLL